jgi:hypothetical protein
MYKLAKQLLHLKIKIRIKKLGDIDNSKTRADFHFFKGGVGKFASGTTEQALAGIRH